MSTPTNLPYRLDPPLKYGEEDSLVAALKKRGNGSFWNILNGKTVGVLVAANAFLYSTELKDRFVFPAILVCLLLWFLLSRILKGKRSSIFFSGLATFFLIQFMPVGSEKFWFVIWALSIVQGFRVSTGKTGERTRYSSGKPYTSISESIQPIWGVAGGHIGSNKAFGDMARVGAEGERVFGVALAKLSKEIPHMRVFHGLCFTPGKPGADIDHIVLIGRNVFILDSKNWAQGSYTWSRSGTVLRDGAEFKGGDVHMAAATEMWKKYLPRNVKITSCLVLTRSNGYQISNSRAGVVTLTTISDMIQELRHVAMNSEPLVDRRLMQAVAAQLQL
jgi:hypothetical protein